MGTSTRPAAIVLTPRAFDFAADVARVADLVLDAYRAGRIRPSPDVPAPLATADALLEAACEVDVDASFTLDVTLVDAARVLTDLDLVDEAGLVERFSGYTADGPCGDVVAMARHAIAREGARGALERIKGGGVSGARSLAAFAARVFLIASGCPGAGPYVDSRAKVYICDVFDRGPDLGLDEAGFKDRLVEANRAGLLQLARADLTPCFDEAKLRRSFVAPVAGAAFHLIRVLP